MNKKIALKMFIFSLLLLGVFIRPSTVFSNYNEESIKKVIEEFHVKALNESVAPYYEDYSMISDDADSLKQMLEVRNHNINERRNVMKILNRELTDIEYEYQDFIILGDHAYVSYYCSVMTLETSINDFGEKEKTEVGVGDNCEVLLKLNDNQEWEVLQAKSDSPWNIMFLNKEEEEKELSERFGLLNSDDSDKGKLESLMNFKYDVSAEKIKEATAINDESNEWIEEEELKAQQYIKDNPSSIMNYRSTTTSYIDGQKVLAYAKTWWNKTNPSYETLRRSADCANYASQILRESGAPQEGRGSYKWGQHKDGDVNKENCSNPRFSWFNARGLYWYLRNNAQDNPHGLNATYYWIDNATSSKNQKLKTGDLLFIMVQNPKNIYPHGGYIAYHSMVVIHRGIKKCLLI